MSQQQIIDRDNLTGLRAFAALSVVLLHYRYAEAADHYGPWAFVFQNQGLGVYVFFMLSGFILAYVHGEDFQRGLGATGAFLWARLARIYPVHLVCLGIVIALALAGIRPSREADTPLMFAANLFLVHAWDVTNAYTFNDVSWSISAEWMAYLLFPLLAFVTQRWKPVALLVLALACAVALERLRWGGLTFGAGCVFYFTIGFAAFRLVGDLPDRWSWNVGAYLSTAALVLMLWLRPLVEFYPFVFAGFTLASIVLIACLYKSPPTWLYANPVSVYGGRISYSLYMSHLLTVTALRYFVGVQPLWLELCAGLVVAAVLYHGVEEPARKLMRNARWHRAPLMGSLGDRRKPAPK